MFKIFTFCFFLLLISNHLIGQQDSVLAQNFNPVQFDRNYLKSGFKDFASILISPIEWKKKDYAKLAIAAGSVGLVFVFDEKIQKWSQQERNTTTDKISKYGLEPWGSSAYSFSMLGLFYLHGAIFKDDKSKATALLGLKAFAISGIIVSIPKYLCGRHRPFQDDVPNPRNWDGPGFSYKSFMSGHTTTSFALATIVAHQYRNRPIVPVISYTIASLTGLSRINDNKHWASDVAGGAFLGYAIGRFIHSRNNWNIQINPAISEHGTSVSCIIPLN
jgi:membrane-associated phospholipid phosphatase